MTKWADYVVSAVRYKQNGKKLKELKVHADGKLKIGAAIILEREEVIEKMLKGQTFVMLRTMRASLRKGNALKVVTLNKRHFLQNTESDQEADVLVGAKEF